MLLEKLPDVFLTVDSCNAAQIALLTRCQPRTLKQLCIMFTFRFINISNTVGDLYHSLTVSCQYCPVAHAYCPKPIFNSLLSYGTCQLLHGLGLKQLESDFRQCPEKVCLCHKTPPTVQSSFCSYHGLRKCNCLS